ncbi:ubiquitin-protein transferase [Aureococcus anophagefferens]|nr:ubiquitin-protein transferase [Aureococcus anophagefferens]
MVVLSFLVVVAVASSDDAPFDAALAAEGARGLAAARTAREGSGPRSLDALGVALRVGCELRVLDGNATLELRAGRRRRRFDVAAPCAGPWPACGAAPAAPLLCAVSSPGPAAPRAGARDALSLYALGVLGVADALLFLDSGAVAGAAFGRPFLETFAAAARGGEVALPAPCYRQFFGAAVLLATATPWAVGFLARWFRLRLRCGPKDQPSLWHLVLRAAGRDDAADAVLGAYHDARCVDAAGALGATAACAPGGVVTRADATCGYYAAWDRANAAFLGDVFAGAVNDTGVLYEVAAPLLVPGGRVAYLPNAGRRDPLLCGDTAPLRHVKFVRKADRDLDARCGAPPPGLLFKGD